MIKFVEVSLKSTYEALAAKDINTVCFINNTKEVFLGENQFGVSVELVDTALPASGVVNKLYIIKSGTNKGIYYWNGTIFADIVSSSTVTTDGTQALKNKTINADDNTITNINIDNFKNTLLDKDLTAGTKTDTTIPTSKAVFDYVSSITGSVFDLQGTVNISSPGTTLNGAKKGYTWIIEGSKVYCDIDFNTNDLIVFIKNITGAPVAGDFVKLDNTESPDIIRKIVGAGIGTIVTFTADGNIQSSGKTISTAEPTSTSTDNIIPTSKGVYTAVNKKSNKPATSTNGNIPKLDASGNLSDAGIAATKLVVTDTSQTLTNKTINAANNTITGLKTTNLDASVLKTSLDSAVADTEILTAKAVYDALKIKRI